jgi:hypothetical protein
MMGFLLLVACFVLAITGSFLENNILMLSAGILAIYGIVSSWRDLGKLNEEIRLREIEKDRQWKDKHG